MTNLKGTISSTIRAASKAWRYLTSPALSKGERCSRMPKLLKLRQTILSVVITREPWALWIIRNCQIVILDSQEYQRQHWRQLGSNSKTMKRNWTQRELLLLESILLRESNLPWRFSKLTPKQSWKSKAFSTEMTMNFLISTTVLSQAKKVLW